MKKTLFTLFTALLIGSSWAFAQGDAELMLKPSAAEVSQGEDFAVDIMLKNPEQQDVISVRSWLNYDPAVLEATSISSKDSPFSLVAPGEDAVSANEGRVKIGRSDISGGVNAPESTVATVNFRVLSAQPGSTTISFYDYQISELGHTSANIIDQGFPVNILSKEPESIQIKLNPGATVAPTPTPTPTPVTTPVPTPGVGGGAFTVNLVRPTDLKVNTGNGYVDLKWNASPDTARAGFNIYYGKNSGQYARRRSIGNFDNYRLDGLNNNETYYFAITAYDQFNQESDYSNEVGIIVNEPLSSTSPFASLLQKVVARIPTQPQNGPLVGWLVFSAAGLGGAIVFGRKKQLND